MEGWFAVPTCDVHMVRSVFFFLASLRSIYVSFKYHCAFIFLFYFGLAALANHVFGSDLGHSVSLYMICIYERSEKEEMRNRAKRGQRKKYIKAQWYLKGYANRAKRGQESEAKSDIPEFLPNS